MSAKRLVDLISDLGLEVKGDSELLITGIAYHSQRVEPGNLFVAIDGLSTRGRDFIDEALDRGARAVAAAGEIVVSRPGVAIVGTGNPRRFLAQVANRFYDFPAQGLRLIGVTGTNGKTTTTYLVKSILEAAGERSGLIGTIRHYDGQEWRKAANTTPESLDIIRLLAQLRKQKIRYCVAEISSHAIALDRIAELAFAVGVFTNLTQDHLDFHGTMEEYRRVKLQFFRTLSPQACLVYNADDPVGAEIQAATPAQAIGYGLKARKSGPVGASSHPDAASVQGEIVSQSDKGTGLRLSLDGAQIVTTTSLIGEHNVYNVMAAAGVGLALGLPPAAVKQGIEQLKAVPGRMERIENKAGLSVFVDYAHSPGALASLIRTARGLTTRKVVVVFGCGGNRDRGKRPQMGRIATDLADLAIVTSDNPRDEDPMAIIEEIKQGIQKSNYEVVENRYAAIKRALFLAAKGDIVMIAGKGHEDYQIVGSERRHFGDREVVKAILG